MNTSIKRSNTINRPSRIFFLSQVALSLSVAASAIGQTEVPHTTPFVFPPAYVTVESGPASNGNSWITIIDSSGDTALRAQPLATSSPYGFTLDQTGAYGESLESATAINYYQAGPGLTQGTVGINTLPAPACVANVFAPTNQLYVLDYKNNSINIGYPTGNPGAFGISVGDLVGTTPVAITGNTFISPNLGRSFVINQNLPYGVACNNIPHDVQQTGSASVFEASTLSIDGGTSISLGRCPVFGVTTTDGLRSFVLNRGDDSVSVIDVPGARLDLFYPTINLPHAAGTHAGPVHAEYVPRLGKLLVANYENDTVSIINVQMDPTGLPGPSFGTVVATVDLWNDPGHTHTGSKHPAGIAALPDGSRAYIANQEDGTVSVLDLRLNEVVSTLTLGNNMHPRSVVVSSNAGTNSNFVKVYLAVPDSSSVPYIVASDNYLTVPSCPNSNGVCAAAGNVSDVRVNAQNVSAGGNTILSSRTPGAGQPCASPNFAPDNLAACLAH